MTEDYRDKDDDEVPVLDEVIRPGRVLDASAESPAQQVEQLLHTEVAAIIERHARAAIEEITVLLQAQRERGD